MDRRPHVFHYLPLPARLLHRHQITRTLFGDRGRLHYGVNNLAKVI